MIKAKRRECSREEKAVKLMEQPRTMRMEKCSLELVTWVETIRDLTEQLNHHLCYLEMVCWGTLLCPGLLVFTKIKH